MQYSPEYRFDLVADGLDAFVGQVNGQFVTYDDDVFAGKLENVRARTSLSMPLMIMAVLLFMLDILARRMNIDYLDWIALFFKRLKNKDRRNEKKQIQSLDETTDETVVQEKQKKKKKETVKKVKTSKQTTKSKKKLKEEAQQELDMEELLRKKEDRQW